LFRPSILDPHHFPADSLAIEGSNGLVCLSDGGHFDEAEDAAVVKRLEHDVSNGATVPEQSLKVFFGSLSKEGGTVGAIPATKRRFDGS